MPVEDYPGAGQRLYHDADRLLAAGRHATATHLFGLAAECALKACMDNVPGDRELPRRHIPELLDDVKALFQGRHRAHIRQVVDNPDFMHGWNIANRYWPDHCFDIETCRRLRQDAYKALSAIPGVI